jgi:hypothetical protein
MNTDAADTPGVLAARYADAVRLEKTAWQALQAQAPGSCDRVQAWAGWMEAIAQTNRAWRELNSRALTNPSARKTLLPNIADRFAGRH